jgi:60 kDa SS-A/Ro ribonucleoprotein
MSDYINHVTKPKANHQGVQAREDQVENSAGGFVFQVDKWDRLSRFLILGSAEGSYYSSAKNLTVENFSVMKDLLKEDGRRVVDTIIEISDQGRAPKNAPAIFALAVCSVSGDEATRAYANSSVSKVCRFSTDLFIWVDTVVALKDGRKSSGLKRAQDIAYQVCKYPSRSCPTQRWSHSDLINIGKVKPPSDIFNTVLKYATYGIATDEDLGNFASDNNVRIGLTSEEYSMLENSELAYIWAHEEAKKASDAKSIIRLVNKHHLTRESIPNEFFTKEVWASLLPTMPMTALIRNLGMLTAKGVLKPMAAENKIAIEKLTNVEALKKSRIHPMTIFSALKTYESGSGMRTEWIPVPKIIEALEDAFYLAFDNVEPTGKNILLGVDVSGSMGWSSAMNNVSCAEAAAVMSMVISRKEENSLLMAFSHQFVDLGINSKTSLTDAQKKVKNRTFGNTDCSLPMTYAMENNLDIDAFVVLTDNETWYGDIHPFEALRKYRSKSGNKDAKLIVAAFSASDFTIADPDDRGMLDIVGLDTAVPQIISDFIKGSI